MEKVGTKGVSGDRKVNSGKCTDISKRLTVDHLGFWEHKIVGKVSTEGVSGDRKLWEKSVQNKIVGKASTK